MEAHGPLTSPPKMKAVVDVFEASYQYITNEGTLFYFKTNLNAPKNRVVKYDLCAPETGFVEVIPEADDVIEFLTVVDKDKLIIVRLKDVKHVATIYNLQTGKVIGPLDLPLGSIISSLSGRR